MYPLLNIQFHIFIYLLLDFEILLIFCVDRKLMYHIFLFSSFKLLLKKSGCIYSYNICLAAVNYATIIDTGPMA